MFNLLRRIDIEARTTPEILMTRMFFTDAYARHNRRRQEHLASLRLPLAGQSVLELGAGVGEHTGFFLDRGCHVTVTDVRPENIRVFEMRYPDVPSYVLDVETADEDAAVPHDIVFAYGLLYHLSDPERALSLFSGWSQHLLLLETCVSFGDEFEMHPVSEDPANATQASSGMGCRPTRPWLFRALQAHFAYVYVPVTQPAHPEFPTDWSNPASRPPNMESRAIFIASREKLDNPWLTDQLPVRQGI